MQKTPKPTFLNVAETVVCRERLFRRFPGGPMVICRLVHFSLDCREWCAGSTELERKTLWRFLNGEEITCENNYVEFIVPDESLVALEGSSCNSEEKLLDYLFFRNPHFQIVPSMYDQDVSVRMEPDSARLVRTFKGCTKRFGKYQKFVIAFTSKVRLLKSVRDIGKAELAKFYWVKRVNERYNVEKSLRAIKAFVADMDGVYVSRQGAFIAPAPQTFDDRVAIFKSELAAECSLDFVPLVKFGVEFAAAEDRKVLAEGLENYQILEYGRVAHINCMFGSGPHSRCSHVSIRLPRADKYPWLFVELVRQGLATCATHINKWIAAGKVRDAVIKFGEFQITVVAPTSMAAPHAQILNSIVKHLNGVAKFLEAAVNFVELLMGGIRNVAMNGSNALEANIGNIVLDKIMLSPADYVDSDIKAISVFARQYMIGE